ncbi:MAG TPA: rhodanese-like domain-containing protein [Gemmatimonadaceae bacterium]|nr:rhodanese-like domain-containing protein [Gemmatimonadaceae bacterium]
MDHSPGFLAIVDQAKQRVREVSADEARRMAKSGALLVDVREDREWEAGHARGAVHLGRGVIERDVEKAIPDKDTEIILYCGGGFRSVLTADSLQRMGYSSVLSLTGGWKAWQENGGEVATGD